MGVIAVVAFPPRWENLRIKLRPIDGHLAVA